MSDAGMTILIGVTVVFSMLLLLTGVFKAFGMIMSGSGKSVSNAPAAAPAVPAPAADPAAAPIVGNTQPVSSQLEIQNGIPEETVAVISAAAAAMAPAGTQYAVRGIRKA
ncbi:MAG: OadG family protein [Clostridia bacterium]|nr:OadG family protein [Clostridia bacterium]